MQVMLCPQGGSAELTACPHLRQALCRASARTSLLGSNSQSRQSAPRALNFLLGDFVQTCCQLLCQITSPCTDNSSPKLGRLSHLLSGPYSHPPVPAGQVLPHGQAQLQTHCSSGSLQA